MSSPMLVKYLPRPSVSFHTAGTSFHRDRSAELRRSGSADLVVGSVAIQLHGPLQTAATNLQSCQMWDVNGNPRAKLITYQ